MNLKSNRNTITSRKLWGYIQSCYSPHMHTPLLIKVDRCTGWHGEKHLQRLDTYTADWGGFSPFLVALA